MGLSDPGKKSSDFGFKKAIVQSLVFWGQHVDYPILINFRLYL